MIRRPPRSTRTDTLFPYTTLFRSYIGETRWDVAMPSDNETDILFWQEHRRQLDNHEAFRGFRYCTLLNGDEMWLEINGKPVLDAENRFMGYRGSGRDITDQDRPQRRIEAALRQGDRPRAGGGQGVAVRVEI